MADTSQHRSHKRVGSVVRGKYRVDGFLATGTMANVYAATHRNGSRVALKIMHAQLAEDPALCERFKREGYFANSIGHPGVVRAIDDDVTEDGCAFLVMELLEGETLDERRRRKGGKLPLGWVLGVADSLLDILAAAHEREVVHRDLKPDNVFVTKDGDVKILDFGVARWNDGKSSSDMTGVGMVLGTPAYMPPEQALGRREDVDVQSDIWAVGATLFVVLSGEPVHAGGDAKSKLIATARTQARALRDVAPEVPRSVAQVIDRALMFHKVDRWPDAHAMREALRWARRALDDEQLMAGGSTEAPAIAAPVPTRRTFDEETTRAGARSDEETAVARVATDDDILTSAPPITLRDAPKGMGAEPASVGPVFSLEKEPVFSLRREKDEDEDDATLARKLPEADAKPPSTERLPKADAAAVVVSEKVRVDDEVLSKSSVESLPPSSMEVSFSVTRPLVPLVFPEQAAPLPAAGAPPPIAAPATTFSSAPPAATVTSSPPPNARAATTDAPGPILSQVVTRRSGPARILLPIALALVVVVGVFAVMKRRASTATAAGQPAPTSIESVASANAEPAPAPSGAVAEEATSASEGASAVAEPAPAPSATPPKRRPKPKPRPPVVTAPREPKEPAEAEPAPPEPPAPIPTPVPPSAPPPGEATE
ncbi:MAG: protein kinase [Labilithrix sp.]|nr:protein kinase [Labilithrix sp.]